jgi:hypothetical protein
MKQKNNDAQENAQVFKAIRRYILFGAGILLAAICIGGMFLSSDWINETYRSSLSDLNNNDSDAGSFLTGLTSYLLDFAIWLKELPVWGKMIGAIVGGALVFFNHDGEFD